MVEQPGGLSGGKNTSPNIQRARCSLLTGRNGTELSCSVVRLHCCSTLSNVECPGALHLDEQARLLFVTQWKGKNNS